MAIRAIVATIAGLVVAAPATAYTVQHVGQRTSEDVPAQVSTESGQGRIVSTIARCAPTGRDAERLEGVRNHGDLVKAAAQGQVVTIDGRSYDLSRLEDAEALCATLASAQPGAQRTARTTTPADESRGNDKGAQSDGRDRQVETATSSPTSTATGSDDQRDGSGRRGR